MQDGPTQSREEPQHGRGAGCAIPAGCSIWWPMGLVVCVVCVLIGLLDLVKGNYWWRVLALHVTGKLPIV